jgi:hypothetical protein
MIAATLGASQSGSALKEASYLEAVVVAQSALHLAGSRNDNHIPETTLGTKQLSVFDRTTAYLKLYETNTRAEE